MPSYFNFDMLHDGIEKKSKMENKNIMITIHTKQTSQENQSKL
jgi:hypothetical protein